MNPLQFHHFIPNCWSSPTHQNKSSTRMEQQFCLGDDYPHGCPNSNGKRKNFEDDLNVSEKLNGEELRMLRKRIYDIFDIKKTPTQVLHELFPGTGTLSIVDKGSSGPSHNPVHTTTVTIEKVGTFVGQSRSKQEAKQLAAKKAFDYLMILVPRDNFGAGVANSKKKARLNSRQKQQKPQPVVANQVHPHDSRPHLSQNNPDSQEISFESNSLTTPTENMEVVRPQLDVSSMENNIINDIVSSLRHNHLNAEQIQIYDGQEQAQQEKRQPATIQSDLESKQEMEVVKYDDAILPYLMDEQLASLICSHVQDKWSELFSPLNIEHLIDQQASPDMVQYYKNKDLWKYGEMAAFVITDKRHDYPIRVISLGSGTKCIASENISLAGDVVSDCHAEIVARRALLCFLYEQLHTLLKDPNAVWQDEIILRPVEGSMGRFRLKENLSLHLYITSPPCGDARIFNFNYDSLRSERRSAAQGLLRVKVEKGQGTIPMPVNYGATWDGIIASRQRTTFMSCTDKIALWNVVGVQGALLSLLLEPIYFDSLVISNLYRPTHLLRGVHRRINDRMLMERIGSESLYRVNKHKVGGAPFNDGNAKGQGLSPAYSHNWYYKINSSLEENLKALEMIGTDNGINYFSRNPSRLCKLELARRFDLLLAETREMSMLAGLRSKFEPKVVKDVSEVVVVEDVWDQEEAEESSITRQPPLSHSDCPPIVSTDKRQSTEQEFSTTHPSALQVERTYLKVKLHAEEYIRVKNHFFLTLDDTGLGTWVSQPIERDMFDIDG